MQGHKLIAATTDGWRPLSAHRCSRALGEDDIGSFILARARSNKSSTMRIFIKQLGSTSTNASPLGDALFCAELTKRLLGEHPAVNYRAVGMLVALQPHSVHA